MAVGEERIVVSVRLRPVNAREAERGDGAEWECSGPTTLRFLGTIPERAMFPATYTYGMYVPSIRILLLLFHYLYILATANAHAFLHVSMLEIGRAHV